MRRRPYAALLALRRSGRAPLDLTVEVVRAILQAETERFQERLRRIDVRRLVGVLSWYSYYNLADAPLWRSRGYPPCAQAQHWLELVERCDEELCSALIQLAALPSAR